MKFSDFVYDFGWLLVPAVTAAYFTTMALRLPEKHLPPAHKARR